MKSLLIETRPFNVSPVSLTEGKRSIGGNPIVEGILATPEIKNGNGRYYSKDLWEREIDKYMESVRANRALGELDHPEDSVVNLKNVSHMVLKVWWDNDAVMGKVKVLDTPSGKILRSLVESGVKLGISSRGLGSTRKEGGKTIVEDDFQLICFDFVQEPSTPGAFMIKESKTLDSRKIWSKTDRLNRILNDIIK